MHGQSEAQAVRQSSAGTDIGGRSYGFASLDSNTGGQHALLAAEAALSISYNGLSQAVMMVSPYDLEDFVLGFSIANGIISSGSDLYHTELTQGEGAAWYADLHISNRAFWNLKQQRRQLAGSSSCGLCGVEALELALPMNLPPLQPAALPPAASLHGLRQRLVAAQQLARFSGAMHAAAFFDRDGNLLALREDIGRHNALDKLIGALERAGHDTAGGFAVVTSRCGLELLHKVVRAGISTLASLSAPTSLTVDWARRHCLNLIHVPQRDTPRVYSPGPD